MSAGTGLSLEQREALARVPVRRGEVARALFVPGGEKPMPVFECDERPETVERARENVQELALGSSAYGIGFSAGAPEDVARFAADAKVVCERR